MEGICVPSCCLAGREDQPTYQGGSTMMNRFFDHSTGQMLFFYTTGLRTSRGSWPGPGHGQSGMNVE